VDVVEHPANEQPFLAPVELKRLAQLKAHLQKRLECRLSGVIASSPYEIRQTAVDAPLAPCLQLHKQRPGTSPSMPRSVCINFKSLYQRTLKLTEFGEAALPLLFGTLIARGFEPFFYGLARQPRELCYLESGGFTVNSCGIKNRSQASKISH